MSNATKTEIGFRVDFESTNPVPALKRILVELDDAAIFQQLKDSQPPSIVACFNHFLSDATPQNHYATATQDLIFQMLHFATPSELDALHKQFKVPVEKGITDLLAAAITAQEEETINYTACTLPKTDRQRELKGSNKIKN